MTVIPSTSETTTAIQAAIDFGISNTDCIACIGGEWHRWTEPYTGQPDLEQVRGIMAKGGVDLAELRWLGVTGGRHRLLPARLGDCAIIGVNELTAIGRGGEAMLKQEERKQSAPKEHPQQPLLVVSAGSGTAMVRAAASRYSHVTGSAVGGGTLLGLGRLLLQSTDPLEIEQLAAEGSANGVDLSLADVITGPIGELPAAATAVNFGRVTRMAGEPSRADLAAGLVTLIGQTIALLAVNAARSIQTEQVVITGHLLDMPTLRAVLAAVGALYGQTFHLPEHGGHATALGALLAAAEEAAKGL